MTYRQSLVDLLLNTRGKRHHLQYDADWLLHVVDSWRVVLGIPSVFG
jgi:hypothetical protein